MSVCQKSESPATDPASGAPADSSRADASDGGVEEHEEEWVADRRSKMGSCTRALRW